MVDKESLKFHVETDDYFGTLASILDLLRQDLNINKFNKTHENILFNCIGNLMYLQNTYKILEK